MLAMRVFAATTLLISAGGAGCLTIGAKCGDASSGALIISLAEPPKIDAPLQVHLQVSNKGNCALELPIVSFHIHLLDENGRLPNATSVEFQLVDTIKVAGGAVHDFGVLAGPVMIEGAKRVQATLDQTKWETELSLE